MTEFFTTNAGIALIILAQALLLVVLLLMSLAVLLYADRKIWAAVQMRKGPNVVGPFGLLQSFADFFKYALKEIVVPAGVDRPVYFLAPMASLRAGDHALGGDPVRAGHGAGRSQRGDPLHLRDLVAGGLRRDHGRLGVELEVPVPRLAALRGADDQLRGLDRPDPDRRHHLDRVAEPRRTSCWRRRATWGLLNWYWLPHLPMVVLFFVSALAETNRPPFDLPEAESELVAGYQVEYSSTPFLLFMIGEYAAMVFMCALISVIFFGGWLSPVPFLPDGMFWMILKICVMFFLFSMVKAIVPRYRYDQLMRIGWKVFLPFSLGWVVLVAFFAHFGLLGGFYARWAVGG